MTTITTTDSTTLLPSAVRYQRDGSCPHCGAAIYIDGDIPGLDRGLPVRLPTPFFTCGCRWQTAPAPSAPVWPVWPTWPTWPDSNLPYPYPQPTWGTPGTTTICSQ